MDAVIRSTFGIGWLFTCYLAKGQLLSYSAGHKSHSRPCTTTSDCDRRVGEVCWWLYEGCNQGHCMCDPRSHVADVNGNCVIVRHGTESCIHDSSCAAFMSCINGTCQCPPAASDDGPACMPPHQKLLGKPCIPSIDKCYHESVYGFAYTEVECSKRSVCECKEGYKQDRRTCRRLHIYETGCSKAFHCEGGAICVDGQCLCPTLYRPVSENTKCAKSGGVTDLPLRQDCDEINERRYCAKGLVCHRCRDDSKPICARYLTGIEPERGLLTNRAATLQSFLSPLVSAIAVVMATTIAIR